MGGRPFPRDRCDLGPAPSRKLRDRLSFDWGTRSSVAAIVSELERKARREGRRSFRAPILPMSVNGTDSAQARA